METALIRGVLLPGPYLYPEIRRRFEKKMMKKGLEISSYLFYLGLSV